MNMKKIIAAALSAAIIGGAVPFSAAAEETGDGITVIDVATSGKFGDISWMLDQQTGVLTISGKGPVAYEGYSPWKDLHKEITSIVVEEGITSLPESVFSLCYAETIDLPSTLTEIQGEALGFLGLTPKLTEIRVAEGNPAFVSADGVLFNKDMTTLLKYPVQKPDESYTVPEGVKSISAAAFLVQRYLRSVTLPEGLETIGEVAFYSCKQIENIDIPESVTEIFGNAFPGTPWLAAKQAEDPLVIVNDILVNGLAAEGKVIIPDNVRRIAPFSFENNENITEVYLPCDAESVGKSAFYHCTSLKKLDTGEVKEIDTLAFCGCSALSEVTLYNTQKIGQYAFADCEKLHDIVIENPRCEIFDDPTTICSGGNDKDGYTFSGTICGLMGSTALEYAKKYGYNYDELILPTTEYAGDVNYDDSVNLNDAVAILQYTALPAKYGLSDGALIRADVVDYCISGVNAADALAIMMVDAGVLAREDLPVSSERIFAKGNDTQQEKESE